MYPKDCLYSKEHEWIRVEEDQCTLGITQFAQDELGEVVYVELPEVGASFDESDEIGSLESVKAVAEIYTPITGEIVAVNEALEDAPETVNEDPHAAGWLVKMRVAKPAELEQLMDAAAYEKLTQAEDE